MDNTLYKMNLKELHEKYATGKGPLMIKHYEELFKVLGCAI